MTKGTGQSARKQNKTHDLVMFYRDEFKRVTGQTPVISMGRDGAIAKRLLDGRAEDEARWLVTEFLERPPKWFADKLGFGGILICANELLSRKAETPEHRRDKEALRIASELRQKGEW